MYLLKKDMKIISIFIFAYYQPKQYLLVLKMVFTKFYFWQRIITVIINLMVNSFSLSNFSSNYKYEILTTCVQSGINKCNSRLGIKIITSGFNLIYFISFYNSNV